MLCACVSARSPIRLSLSRALGFQEEEEARLRAEFAAQGIIVPTPEKTSIFDSNIITPGTGFMHRLSAALQYYIHARMNTDSAWQQVKVVLSDANVPGEGEHKIMSFIRLQRGRPGWNPNTKHVLYGLDADLIMLGLATHEAHFSILRENVFDVNPNRNANVSVKEMLGPKDEEKMDVYEKPFQMVDISIVRECIDMELRGIDSEDADVDRLVDDFVFLCFFVGNDFLPHVPTLEIREGAIDLLMHVYRMERRRGIGGYLTDGATIDVQRVENFLRLVASSEEAIFRKRHKRNMRFQDIQKRRDREKRQDAARLKDTMGAIYSAGLVPSGAKPAANRGAAETLKRKLIAGETGSGKKAHTLEDGKDDAPESWEMRCHDEFWKKVEDAGAKTDTSHVASAEESARFKTSVSDAMKERNDLSTVEKYKDTVRLGEDGWKERYYKNKFGATTPGERQAIIRDVVSRYVEGLQWVMRYYYDGVASWEWYFPYHYAPFASDFRDLASIDVQFSIGKPFRPFDQLMGVLPAASGHCLPDSYSSLMKSPDSPIIDFYPTDFDIDLNGKKFAWQAVVLLPFIDQQRLLKAISSAEASLSEDERRRNCTLTTLVFAHDKHPIAEQMLKAKGAKKLALDASLSDAMSGYVQAPDGETRPSRLEPPSALPSALPIEKNHVACNAYFEPDYAKHECRMLPGAIPPAATLNGREDIHVPDRLWHQDQGPGGNFPPRPGSYSGGGGGRGFGAGRGAGRYGGGGGGSGYGGMGAPTLAHQTHRLLDRSMSLNMGSAPRGRGAGGNVGVYRQMNSGGGMYGGQINGQPTYQSMQQPMPVATYNPFSSLERPPPPQQQQQQMYYPQRQQQQQQQQPRQSVPAMPYPAVQYQPAPYQPPGARMYPQYNQAPQHPRYGFQHQQGNNNTNNDNKNNPNRHRRW